MMAKPNADEVYIANVRALCGAEIGPEFLPFMRELAMDYFRLGSPKFKRVWAMTAILAEHYGWKVPDRKVVKRACKRPSALRKIRDEDPYRKGAVL
jgi:hypothetical protein